MTESVPAAHPRRLCPLRPLAFLAVLLGCTAVSAQDMQVIDLHYRLADQVIPVLQPLLDPGDGLTGVDDKLFLRAGPATQARVREALAVIDRPPRQLVISVGQGTASGLSATDVRGSATVSSGDVSIGVNRPPGVDSSASVVARERQQQANLQNVSTVRALEGTEAYISMGRSVPYTTTTVTSGWGAPVAQQSTTFRDANTGFYATPRVNGDTVTLVISPRQQSYEPGRGGTIRTAGTDSTVTARLGEWVHLGAVNESASSDTGGLLVWGRYSSGSRYEAWIKVDELPQ